MKAMEPISPDRQTSREVNFIARGKHLTKIEEYTLLAIVSTCEHFGKLYCYISRETILERVCKWYGHPASLRTLDRAIRRLVDVGLISRQLRPVRPNVEGKEWTSSLSYLKARLKDLYGKLLRLPRAIGSAFRLPSVANYSLLPEKVSGWGPSERGSPKPREGLEGGPAGTISFKDTPQHNLPAETKALWKKMGLVEG